MEQISKKERGRQREHHSGRGASSNMEVGAATRERGWGLRYKLRCYPYKDGHPIQVSGRAAQKQCLERKGPREEPWETPIFVEQVEQRSHGGRLQRTVLQAENGDHGVLAAKR